MSAPVAWKEMPVSTRSNFSLRDFLVAVLEPLASLKLTVVLFALSIFIVLAGTLAQVDKDIWDVIRIYFRAPIAWIDPHIFFPPSFVGNYRPQFPDWVRIPFPGGWLIGAVMALNLVAAHLVRFHVHARGPRLVVGLFVIALGAVLTWVVVQYGANKDGLQQEPAISYATLWNLFLWGLGAGCLVLAWGTYSAVQASRSSRFGWAIATLGCALFLGWLLWQGDAARLSDSAMRILWQLTKGSVAAVVLLAGCGIVFGQRAGIVLLHAGVGLMMFGELLVGLVAVEGQMPIEEGQSISYVQDVRTWELALVDPSNAQADQVVIIPKGAVLRALEKQQPIVDERLPFRVEVLKFFENALVRERKPDEAAVATKGIGRSAFVQSLPPTSGTDSSGKVDQPAVYLKLTSPDGKEDLGTYLFGMRFSYDDVVVGDKAYQMALRFKRTYKPYSIELKDFRKDDYLGTNTPRSYESDIVLRDGSRHVERDVKIWMNNPLRFAGETFYQSSFFQDPENRTEGTVLSVVSNTGWMIPYVGCMIVAIGMLAHFGITLTRFLRRAERSAGEIANGADVVSDDPRRRAAKRVPAVVAQPLGVAGWLLPAAVVTVAAVGALMQSRVPAPRAAEYDFYRFGQIPVVADGRSKPVDTLARHMMLAISGKQTWKDQNERTQPAVKWFLDMMATPKVGAEHHVIRIENLEVQELLGLGRREGFRYGLGEVFAGMQKFAPAAKAAYDTPANERSVYQRKLLELKKKLEVFDLNLFSFMQPPISGEGEQIAQSVIGQFERQRELKKEHPPLAIPPMNEKEAWETYASGWLWNLMKGEILHQPTNPFTNEWTAIFTAYEKREPDAFNAAVAKLHRLYQEDTPKEVNLGRVEFESYFNRAQPMTFAIGLYVMAFVIAALGWLCLAFNWPAGLQIAGRTAFALTAFTLIIHTLALAARMYISGRPPVTNLYSSAVFIGWGCVVLGLVLEVIFRRGMGNVVAAVAGYSTLLIAWGLESDGSDTFSVMQAVLDTQFWLATHVTCITLGYATTYLAGLFGLLYIVLGLMSPWLTPQLAKDLNRMNYGTLCFSIFFSFVGTVLGGLWADDSWGRFWGWDPKENGALMIVLWNALALHARWGGMVKERGLAVLSVIGNIVVSWSWFGVNALSVGLHAYGFDQRIFTLFCGLTAVNLGIMALGLVPHRLWRSR